MHVGKNTKGVPCDFCIESDHRLNWCIVRIAGKLPGIRCTTQIFCVSESLQVIDCMLQSTFGLVLLVLHLVLGKAHCMTYTVLKAFHLPGQIKVTFIRNTHLYDEKKTFERNMYSNMLNMF